MIYVSQKGDWSATTKFLNKANLTVRSKAIINILVKYGELGVKALAAATPIDSGKTALSWGYTIKSEHEKITLQWTNSNVNDGWANVAILLQYGHGTGTGGYVQGIDYINPALAPIFEQMAQDIWLKIVEVK